MKQRKLRINGHSHLLPYPEEIPQFMKDKGIFWVDKDRKYMLQKGWNRPITDSSFFLNEKLEWKVSSRIGSLDNAQHRPGGGKIKVGSI